MGLGLLACAGAVVDYWPVNDELPATPAVSGLVRETPVLVQDLTRVIPAPQIRVVAPPRPADFVTADTVNAFAANFVAGDAPMFALEAAPLPENLVIVDPTPAAGASDEVLELDLAPMPITVPEESRLSFSEALRRTKVRMAAARVLLNDAMTGVVGAFRKVSPFFSTTAIVPGL